jgi:hypothetical protein
LFVNGNYDLIIDPKQEIIDFMYVLSETVFEDWVTFQYHEDAMKLQLSL